MQRKLSIPIIPAICTAMCLPASLAATSQSTHLTKPQIVEAYGRLPLSFEENQGQMDTSVRFHAHGSGYSLSLTSREAVLNLLSPMRNQTHLEPPANSDAATSLRMQVAGARPDAKVSGVKQLPGRSNYFIGKDPANWRTNVPNYAEVKYTDVYTGVDLVYHGNQGQLEFDFIVKPGADANQIALNITQSGTRNSQAPGKSLRIDRSGNLVVTTGSREVRFQKPDVYQRLRGNAGRTIVDGRFVLTGAHRVGFKLGPFDHSRELVIDPVLAYSTLLGSSSLAAGGAITVDNDGDAYVTGYTSPDALPPAPGYHHEGSESDIFVSKLNATGSALIYCAYLGGAGFDSGTGITLDAKKEAYIVGWSSSTDYPVTKGAYQTTNGGANAIISKLSADGSRLLLSTFLGGSGDEGSSYLGIALDSADSIYITGDTSSTDFPVSPHAFQPTPGGGQVDAFVSKLNPAGSALVYSSYLGGADVDEGTDIAVDALGNAYVSGHTFSVDFPTTPAAYQPTHPGGSTSFIDSAFVTKINPSGTALIYSTYLSGAICGQLYINTSRFALVLDNRNNAFLTGYTTCQDFPTTTGAYQTNFGGDTDAFVTKLNARGSALIYSTFLGGSDIESGDGIGIDVLGDAYVEGQTASTNFPTSPNAYQSTLRGINNAFVSKVSPTGSKLLYSTYFGGSDNDNQSGGGLATDSRGNVYVTGDTFSTDFPTTPKALQTVFTGNDDAYIAKFKIGIDSTPTAQADDKEDGEYSPHN